MRRFNNIVKNANDIMTELIELRLENDQFKYAETMREANGENKDLINQKDVAFLVDFGKSMLKEKFKKEIRYNGDLEFDDDGNVDRTFGEWYDENFRREKNQIVPSSISADRIKDMLRSSAQELYDEDYEKAKMAWVRSHKEEE